jgi:RNA polymerase sigma-70 factor (ECF subfamily)
MAALAMAQVAQDFELATASARGDMVAFERLYETHYRRVYSLCLRLVGNVTDAEDLTQEVFIHLYRKIGSFRGDSAFTTWLHRLTINLVLMHLRKRKMVFENMDNEQVRDYCETQGGHTEMSSVLDRIMLEKALKELPAGYRTILVLHDVEGYGHHEIAAMLDITIGTTKSQLHKARLRLRKLLRRRR